MELYTNQLQLAQFNVKTTSGGARVKGSNKKVYKKGSSKCYDIFTFDIENTNGWIMPDGTITSYVKGKSAEYWNNLEPFALVYVWQFSFNDKVYYGRDLCDFLHVMDDLPKDYECIIWVHNLGHEFCFLENILTIKECFARGSHSPIKVTYEEYPNITFRCTYALTNMSLELWGKQIGCSKLVGELDYDAKIRTPYTTLTDNELSYAERDCIVVYNGILNELKTYKNIYDIPLTSTGKIRKVCKKLLFDDKNYSNYIKRLVPTYDELVLLTKCFSGGYTHCNRIHADQLISDTVISHWDFTSSYPTSLCAFRYPSSRFRKSDGLYIHNSKTSREKYAFMYTLRFKNVVSTNPNTYIQLSKAICTGHVIRDNGRLIKADICELSCTDVDFDIISMVYKWDYLEVKECWYAYKDYLPRDFLDYVLTLYADKTQLKGVMGQENFYAQQKAFLNSLY